MRDYGIRKRVLVTGGAGFLGSHLCERLLVSGRDVLCADNFFTGTKDSIAHLLPNPRFELMRHDVTFPLYVEVDEIYNLACPASPIQLGEPQHVAELVIKLTKSKSTLSSKPLPADDPTQRQPDIGLARKMLRWEPNTQLEAGLLNTIAHFNGLMKSGVNHA